MGRALRWPDFLGVGEAGWEMRRHFPRLVVKDWLTWMDDSGGHVQQLFGGRSEHRVQCGAQLPAFVRQLVAMTVG